MIRRAARREKPADAKAAAPKPTPAKAKPRPSRSRLDQAEQAIEDAPLEHEKAVSAIRAEERRLQKKRRDLEQDFEAKTSKLENAAKRARDSYSAALQKWRS